MHKLIETYQERRRVKYDREIAKRESREENRVSPRNPIASNINRDCLREMVLAMNHPTAKIVRDHDRLERFEDAIEAAKGVRRELEDFGFDVTDVETYIPPVRGKKGKTILTGVIDFIVRFDGKRYPVEVKSPHPLIFEKLHSLEDFERRTWTKKWVDQILAYLYAHDLQFGFICVTALGAKRWIEVDLADEDLLERAKSAMEIAERAASAYRNGKLPDFARDEDVCRGCWAFGVVCQPPLESRAAETIDDEEFYNLALRAAEIKPLAKEYEAIWKFLTKTVRATGAEKVVAGDVAFTVTEVPVKEYTVAARVDQRVKMFRVGAAKRAGEESA